MLVGIVKVLGWSERRIPGGNLTFHCAVLGLAGLIIISKSPLTPVGYEGFNIPATSKIVPLIIYDSIG